MATTKAQQKAVHKYVRENYDRIGITIPKGQKATVQAAAEQVSDLGLADVAAQGEEHNRHGEDAESNICRV